MNRKLVGTLGIIAFVAALAFGAGTASAFTIADRSAAPWILDDLKSGADLPSIFSSNEISAAAQTVGMAADTLPESFVAEDTTAGYEGYTNLNFDVTPEQFITVRYGDRHIAMLGGIPGRTAAETLKLRFLSSGITEILTWTEGNTSIVGSTSPMPEPTSALLFLAGVLVVGQAVRRKSGQAD